MIVNDIVYDSTVDGYGLRTTIFFQGCKHACEGCHNKDTWDLNGGYEISPQELFAKVEENNFTKKVTISGGEPLLQKELVEFLELLKHNNYNVWLYTGFLKEDIDNDILDKIDVLVDGKFVLELKDSTLGFRGSSNQRVINLKGEK